MMMMMKKKRKTPFKIKKPKYRNAHDFTLEAQDFSDSTLNREISRLSRLKKHHGDTKVRLMMYLNEQAERKWVSEHQPSKAKTVVSR